MAKMIPGWLINAVRTGTKHGGDVPTWFPSNDDSNVDLGEVTPMDGVHYLDPTTTPKVGVGGKPSKIVSYSYWNTPIVDRPLKGNSRKWGDASPEVKEAVQGKLIEAAQSAGLDKKDTALLLAIANVESGFNPDAAAGTTSAHGVGQFINKTGTAYKLNEKNRWDVDEQIRALVEHFIDNKIMARDKGREYIYAYHHDGPSLKYGGLNLSRKRVMPLADQYLASLSGDAGEDIIEQELAEEEVKEKEKKSTG